MPELRIFATAALPPGLHEAIYAVYGPAFVAENATALHWRDDPDWRLLIYAADPTAWLCTLEIFAVTVRLAGQPVPVGGLGGVYTQPAARGHGYAAQALQAALAFCQERLPAAAGLLFCLPPLIPYYQQQGWQVMTGPVMYRDPAGIAHPFTGGMTAMLYPLNRSLSPVITPAAALDLNGLPW